MPKVDLAKIADKAAALGNNIDNVNDAVRSIQSVKCRLKKQKFKKSYDAEMREVLAEEQLLKEVRDYLLPKKATVTTITPEAVAKLTWDDTIKAIKSIQSKKTNTKFETPDLATNAKYQEACRIEAMLLAHKATIVPVEDTIVKKIDVHTALEHLESLNLTAAEQLAYMKKVFGNK